MKHAKVVLSLAVLLATMPWAHTAAAQTADPTASRLLQLSAFGALSGDLTGLSGGRNLAFTAGVDLGLPPWRGVRPTIEVRGSYPIDRGKIDSQESVLAGLRIDFLLDHRLRPYGDFLFGRGQMNYGSGGYIFGNADYADTTTYIDSPGAGFNYNLSEHLALKVDGQFQRWASAPTPSGLVYAKVGTIGIVYNFTFHGRNRRF